MRLPTLDFRFLPYQKKNRCFLEVATPLFLSALIPHVKAIQVAFNLVVVSRTLGMGPELAKGSVRSVCVLVALKIWENFSLTK